MKSTLGTSDERTSTPLGLFDHVYVQFLLISLLFYIGTGYFASYEVASCELLVTSCELRVASCELRGASCELRVASCELRVASY